MNIIQTVRATGVNPTVNFTNPTILNSTIVVLCATSDPATNFNNVTDSASQAYQFAPDGSFVNGALQTMWFSVSFSVAGVTSITLDSNGGVIDVFIYEITQPANGSGTADFGPGD